MYMADNLKLPVGVDNFEKIRRNRFYYIDKTKADRTTCRNGWGGNTIYASSSFWKDIKYEYVAFLF